MRKDSILPQNESFVEGNIFSDKAAVILHWILIIGFGRKHFAVREVARETGVSLGWVQKTLKTLAYHGIIKEEGVHTAKKFVLLKPQTLLSLWTENYNIVKKCKSWSYEMVFSSKEQALDAIKKAKLGETVVWALHSAAESYGYKNTNLDTLELYLLKEGAKEAIEEVLELSPKERGYEVLLIQPYYKTLLTRQASAEVGASSPIITYLDLFHFTLRGREQAEFLASRSAELKRIVEAR